MKRRIALVILFLILLWQADRIFCAEPELVKARGTAYVIKGTCADGSQTRKGIAAAPRELLGKTIIVYLRHYKDNNSLGSFVGIYEVNDVCPEGNIDIWCEDMDEVQEMMNKFYEEDADGRIYYQILDGVKG